MTAERALFQRRAEELAFRSNGRYTFTDFLTPAEQGWLAELSLPVPCRLFGGAESCERRMAAFGDERLLGYAPEFPIACLHISPLSAKFAEPLSHRDVLGAVLSLGLERRCVGDIFLGEGDAYLLLSEHMLQPVSRELVRIRRTDVRVERCDADRLPAPRMTQKQVVAASMRADALLCAVFNLSRSEGAALFGRSLVFKNSLPLSSPSAELREGDVLSLRGKGRFRVEGVTGTTGKGRLHVRISLYG